MTGLSARDREEINEAVLALMKVGRSGESFRGDVGRVMFDGPTVKNLARALADLEAENERLREAFSAARSEIAQAISAHYDEADASDDEGAHIGFARHHRALAQGMGKALLICDKHATALEASGG